jgi:hypothetical protein
MIGRGLGAVRLHNDSKAHAKADDVGARAFTRGQDIYFAKGEYDPDSGDGQRLIAHEVAHTVQQSGGTPTTQRKPRSGGSVGALEQQADRFAIAVCAGIGFAEPILPASNQVLRAPDKGAEDPGTAPQPAPAPAPAPAPKAGPAASSGQSAGPTAPAGPSSPASAAGSDAAQVELPILSEINAWAQSPYADGFDGKLGDKTSQIMSQPSPAQTAAPDAPAPEATQDQPAGPAPASGNAPVQQKSALAAPAPTMPTEASALLSGQIAPAPIRAVAAPAVHDAATTGIAGTASSLPHFDTIQEAFGHHDVSSISAHVGGAASDACDDMGAEAFATGSSVAFRSAPDLHTAAHEAAHIVQQRHGVELEGAVGKAGDAYERNADAVADAVVAGKSAQPLLDTQANSSGPRNKDKDEDSKRNVQRKEKRAAAKRRARRAAIQLKINASAPAFPGYAQIEVVECERQEGTIMVPTPYPDGEGFGMYESFAKNELPGKLQACADSRTALDGAIETHKGAIAAGLAADKQQGVKIENDDSVAIQAYTGAMRDAHKSAGDGGSAAAKAVIAGQRLVAFQLAAVEGDEAAAVANAEKASKAGTQLVSDLFAIGGIVASFAIAGPAGAAAYTLAMKKNIGGNLIKLAGLVHAKQSAAQVKSQWASKKSALVQNGITESDMQHIVVSQGEVAGYLQDVKRHKADVETAMADAMIALDSIAFSEIDSAAMKAVAPYLAAVKPLGATHKSMCTTLRGEVAADRWSAWQQTTDGWVSENANLHDEMHMPAQKTGGGDEFEPVDQTDNFVRMQQAMVGVNAIGSWVQACCSWAVQQSAELEAQANFATGPHLKPAEDAIQAVMAMRGKKPKLQ